ncbi:DNA alkylation repair protein [Candidatus Saccharibacteria bacterium]|nr:DNA alkylation repair protein [Candidatus Saccharibacteria bacterium]
MVVGSTSRSCDTILIIMLQTPTEFKTKLASLVDDEYREFAMRGIPSERPFLGVKIPQIRKLVGEIAPESYPDFLSIEPIALEEVLARGMIICKLPYDEMLKYYDSQINQIDDWCTCDTFCSGLANLVKKHRAEFLDTKIEQLLNDSREYAVRAGLVMLKCAYIDFDYLAVIFDRIEMLAAKEEYYIKMATAWLLSECFVKFPEETFAFLKTTHLPKWTYNKTISKIYDSHRIDPEIKTHLRKLRK